MHAGSLLCLIALREIFQNPIDGGAVDTDFIGGFYDIVVVLPECAQDVIP